MLYKNKVQLLASAIAKGVIGFGAIEGHLPTGSRLYLNSHFFKVGTGEGSAELQLSVRVHPKMII